jgi:hypothetical protein
MQDLLHGRYHQTYILISLLSSFFQPDARYSRLPRTDAAAARAAFSAAVLTKKPPFPREERFAFLFFYLPQCLQRLTPYRASAFT